MLKGNSVVFFPFFVCLNYCSKVGTSGASSRGRFVAGALGTLDVEVEQLELGPVERGQVRPEGVLADGVVEGDHAEDGGLADAALVRVVGLDEGGHDVVEAGEDGGARVRLGDLGHHLDGQLVGRVVARGDERVDVVEDPVQAQLDAHRRRQVLCCSRHLNSRAETVKQKKIEAEETSSKYNNFA